MKNFARPLSRLILISFTWGSLAMLVALAHSSTAYAAEPICNRSDILLCEDWADGDHVGWDWDSSWGSEGKRWQIVASGGFDDANALKMTINQNRPETIYPETRSMAPQQGETYLRFYIKWSPGFKFNPGWSGGKVAYLNARSGGNLDWRVQINLRGHNNDTQGSLSIDLRRSNWSAPDQPEFLLSNVARRTYLDSGRWYAVELMVKPNTPGVKDGVIKLWIDGVLYMHHTGQSVRGNLSTPINHAWLTSYFGGQPTAHPTQWVWYDNIVVSTSYVGPFPVTTDTTPPNAPSGLRVE